MRLVSFPDRIFDEKEVILNENDLLNMLDSLLREEAPWWDHFYSDRQKKVPFFVSVPDENLVEYIERSIVRPGRVLELGCGPGRNAIYLASLGCQVDGVDLSGEALQWTAERAVAAGITSSLNLHKMSLFDFSPNPESYDLVYDSGCFHHIPPHRRMDYVRLITNALRPGTYFGLTCFAHGDQCT